MSARRELYERLEGKPVRLQYLPKATSRVWRNSSVEWRGYNDIAYDYALGLQKQEGWWDFRFVALEDER